MCGRLAWQCGGREPNPQPDVCNSSAVTTTPMNHTLALNSMVVSFVCGQNELSTVMSFPKNENWKIVKNVVDENLSQ